MGFRCVKKSVTRNAGIKNKFTGQGFSNLAIILLTNILAGKPDHSAGHVERILAALQHAAQPVQRRILVRASHGLMQR